MVRFHIDEAIRLIKTHVFVVNKEDEKLNPEDHSYTVDLIAAYLFQVVERVKISKYITEGDKTEAEAKAEFEEKIDQEAEGDAEKLDSAIQKYKSSRVSPSTETDYHKIEDWLKEEYKILSKKTPVSGEDLQDPRSFFRKVAVKNFDLYPIFLDKIYRNWTVDNYSNFFIKSLSEEIYYHLIKSFLNAEYLIKDDYGKTIYEQILKVYFEEIETYPNPDILYLQKSLLKVFWQIIGACKTIRHQLEYPNKKIVLIEQDREQKANTFFISRSDKLIGKKETVPYENFMESLIDITIIDHIYRSNRKNLKQLFLFLERAQDLEKGFVKKTKPLVELAKLKANTLLYGILSQKDKYYIFSTEQNIEFFTEDNTAPFDKYKFKKESLYGFNNVASNILKRYIDKDEIRDYKSCDYKGSKFEDLSLYDMATEKGIKKYNSHWKYFEKLRTLDNSIDIENQIQYLKECIEFCKNKNSTVKLSLPFLLKLIFSLHKIIEKSFIDLKEFKTDIPPKFIGDVEYFIRSMKGLLSKLHLFINTFENENAPYSFHPYFKDCFYQKTQNNDIKTFSFTDCSNISYNYSDCESCFFISSFHTTPLEISYIKMFYKKYNEKYYEKVNELTNKSLLNDIKAGNKKTTKKIKKELRRNKKRTKKTLTQYQNSTITLLGIFAALLAFVTFNIGIIRIISNIWEYILFSATFALFLSLLVFLVKIKKIKNKTKAILYMIGAFIVLVIGSGIYFYFTPPSKNLPQKEEKTNIENSIIFKENSTKHSKQIKKQKFTIDTLKKK